MGLTHIRELVNEAWAIKLPLIFNPWLTVDPVVIVSAINRPLAWVTVLANDMVEANMATDWVGLKEATDILTVPVVIKTTS